MATLKLVENPPSLRWFCLHDPSQFAYIKVLSPTLNSRIFCEDRSGFVRVLENLESPGILLCHFPGLESPGKRSLVLESSGNLLNSAKKYEVYGRQ